MEVLQALHAEKYKTCKSIAGEPQDQTGVPLPENDTQSTAGIVDSEEGTLDNTVPTPPTKPDREENTEKAIDYRLLFLLSGSSFTQDLFDRLGIIILFAQHKDHQKKI